MGTYPPRVRWDQSPSGVAVSTPCGAVSTRGIFVLFPGLLELVVEMWKDFPSRDGNLSSPGAVGPRGWLEGQLSPRASSMSPSQSAITLCGWGFPTLRGSIDPGDLRFRPRVLGVVEVWKDL